MSTFLAILLGLPSVAREEKQLADEANEILRFIGLAPRGDLVASSLPYGELRLLEVAVALAARPKLLLLDEPVSGMNPAETASFMQMLSRIRALGITVLLVEHDMKMVMGVSDRVVCLCVASEFWSVGQFYRSFAEVTDDKVEQLLRESARTPRDTPPDEAGDRNSAERAPAVAYWRDDSAAVPQSNMSAAWRHATSRLPQPPGETPRPLPIEIPVVPEPVPGLVPEVPVPPVEVPAPAPSEVPEPRERARGG